MARGKGGGKKSKIRSMRTATDLSMPVSFASIKSDPFPLCVSKRKFESEEAGKQYAALMLEKGAKRWVYRCVHCGAWHLTKQEPAHNRKTFRRNRGAHN